MTQTKQPPGNPARFTPSEAADVGHALAAHIKAIETAELHERMRRIEEGTRQ